MTPPCGVYIYMKIVPEQRGLGKENSNASLMPQEQLRFLGAGYYKKEKQRERVMNICVNCSRSG